jgi:hypothetical protein
LLDGRAVPCAAPSGLSGQQTLGLESAQRYARRKARTHQLSHLIDCDGLTIDRADDLATDRGRASDPFRPRARPMLARATSEQDDYGQDAPRSATEPPLWLVRQHRHSPVEGPSSSTPARINDNPASTKMMHAR